MFVVGCCTRRATRSSQILTLLSPPPLRELLVGSAPNLQRHIPIMPCTVDALVRSTLPETSARHAVIIDSDKARTGLEEGRFGYQATESSKRKVQSLRVVPLTSEVEFMPAYVSCSVMR